MRRKVNGRGELVEEDITTNDSATFLGILEAIGLCVGAVADKNGSGILGVKLSVKSLGDVSKTNVAKVLQVQNIGLMIGSKLMGSGLLLGARHLAI